MDAGGGGGGGGGDGVHIEDLSQLISKLRHIRN
jgi:hypothetical protein